MSALIKRAAGGLTVLESLWALYLVYSTSRVTCLLGCPGPMFSAVYSDAIVFLAAVLLIDGLLGLWGAHLAYSAGALLSAASLALLGYAAWAGLGYPNLLNEAYGAAVGAGISVIALGANLAAARSHGVLSEQANPMNLPVFG